MTPKHHLGPPDSAIPVAQCLQNRSAHSLIPQLLILAGTHIQAGRHRLFPPSGRRGRRKVFRSRLVFDLAISRQPTCTKQHFDRHITIPSFAATIRWDSGRRNERIVDTCFASKQLFRIRCSRPLRCGLRLLFFLFDYNEMGVSRRFSHVHQASLFFASASHGGVLFRFVSLIPYIWCFGRASFHHHGSGDFFIVTIKSLTVHGSTISKEKEY